MKRKPPNHSLPKAAVSKISEFRTMLNNSIQATCQIAPYCCKNPEKDFTRTRRLPFESVVKQVLTFQNKALQNELFDFFENQEMVPTKSALIQQRHKIKTEAFDFLYHIFMDKVKLKQLFHGYSLYACDGSTINLPRNPMDHATSVSAKPEARSYNQIHLNALYDLTNKVFVNFTIDDGVHIREMNALYQMASAIQNPEHSILVADRGYGYYNTVAFLNSLHCHFVIRMKDINSISSPLHQLKLPDVEFDRDIDVILTESQKKQFRDDPHYLILSKQSGFNFFEDGFANLKFRVLRFLLPTGEYETLITDLGRDVFSSDALKQVYYLRWGIETSFRDLKYTLNLVFFHSRQYDFIIQELISRILMYNVYSLMIQCVPKISNPDLKYVYRANFLASIGSLRDYVLSGNSVFLSRLLYNLHPFRPNRSVLRGNLHDTKPAKSFNYRAS